MLEKLLGIKGAGAVSETALLAADLEQNGPRQHYMRATMEQDAQGVRRVRPVPSQDSSLLSPLSQADCLIVRAPGAPAAGVGDKVTIVPLEY